MAMSGQWTMTARWLMRLSYVLAILSIGMSAAAMAGEPKKAKKIQADAPFSVRPLPKGDYDLLKQRLVEPSEWLFPNDRDLTLIHRDGSVFAVRSCLGKFCRAVCLDDSGPKRRLTECAPDDSKGLRISVRSFGLAQNAKISNIILTIDENVLPGGLTSIVKRSADFDGEVEPSTVDFIWSTGFDTPLALVFVSRQTAEADQKPQSLPANTATTAPTPIPAPAAALTGTISETPVKPQSINKVTVVIPYGLESKAFSSLASDPAKWLACIDNDLVKGGVSITKVERTSKSLNQSTDLGLDLTFAQTQSNKGNFLGVPLPCVVNGNCSTVTPAVKVPLFAVRIDHSPDMIDLIWKRPLFTPTKSPFAKCLIGDRETYFLYSAQIEPWPQPDLTALSSAQLVLRNEKGEEVTKGPLTISDKKPGVQFTASLQKTRPALVMLAPIRDDGVPLDVAKAREFLAGLKFSVTSRNSVADLKLDTNEGSMFLKGEVALERQETPVVNLPPGFSKTLLKEDRENGELTLAYTVILPSVAFKPVGVAIGIQRSIYGTPEAVSDYPGRDCRLTLVVDKSNVEWPLEYKLNNGIVRLVSLPAEPGKPDLPAAQEAKSLVAAAGQRGRVRITPAQPGQFDSDGRACSDEMKVASLAIDAANTLTGDIQLPHQKPIVLGLIAPQANSADIDAGASVVRDTVDGAARALILAMGETYVSQKEKWTTGDIFVLNGTESVTTDLVAKMPTRLIAGGLTEKSWAKHLRFVSGGQAIYGTARNSGTTVKADELLAAIRAYREIHGLTNAPKEAKLIVLALVTAAAKDATCQQWAKDFDTLGPQVSVVVMIADDRPSKSIKPVETVKCSPPGSNTEIFRFSLADAVQSDTATAISALNLEPIVSKAMNK